jgi:fatty acid desaturase
MITDAENDAGLLAYEQTLAFAALHRKRLPLVYALFTLLLAVAGISFLAGGGFYAEIGAGLLVTALLFGIFAIWNWRRLLELDARNRALLARLHAQYGDDLPWLQVERQMSEIRKIEVELEKQKFAERAPDDTEVS